MLTELRVEAVFVPHRLVVPAHQEGNRAIIRPVRQWYHKLAHLFDPDHHSTIAMDETKLKVEETEVYIWAAIDVETFEAFHIEVVPGRSDLEGCCSSSKY